VRVDKPFAIRIEEQRSQEVRELIRSQERTLVQAKTLTKWVQEEREATKLFKAQVDDAIRYEREHGLVLADERPEIWDQVYAFAEGHLDWKDEATRAVAPVIEHWFEDTKDFAFIATHRLRAKVRAGRARRTRATVLARRFLAPARAHARGMDPDRARARAAPRSLCERPSTINSSKSCAKPSMSSRGRSSACTSAPSVGRSRSTGARGNRESGCLTRGAWHAVCM
jgi:hypothetical protein